MYQLGVQLGAQFGVGNRANGVQGIGPIFVVVGFGGDRLQQHVQFVVGGRAHLDEGWRAISAAPIHPVQHEAVQVNIEEQPPRLPCRRR